MAESVFILGAGASVAAGAPLMAKFIDQIEDLYDQQKESLLVEDFDIVLKLVRTRFSELHARTRVDVQNIEAVFSLIEMGKLIRRLPNMRGQEVDRAAKAIRNVLAETIEFTCQFPVDAATGFRPHSEYATLVQKTCEKEPEKYAFITFNYDLALDVALHFAGLTRNYALPNTSTRGVPVLKLHGSLNWRLCEACGTIRPMSIRRILAEQGTPSSGALRLPLRALPAIRELACKCGGESLPAIVPPTWNKTQYHARFADIWTQAAVELKGAKYFYVIGYSFPASDAFFRDLLALGLHQGMRPRKFVVVDPNIEVAKRFQDLLGPVFDGRFEHQKVFFTEFAETL